MGLRKRHVKKRNPRVHNSGFFGIMAQAESFNLTRNSDVSLPHSLRKSVRDAMLEAEYRKAQVTSLTRRMHYM